MAPASRRATLAVSAAAVAVLLSACSSDGIGAVAEDEAFSSCVSEAGASLEGSDDWGEKEQLAFWDEPATLDCALDELDDDQLEDALAGAFRDFDKSDLDDPRAAQLAVLGHWASQAGADLEESDATRRAATLIDSLWVNQDDPDARASGNGMEQVLAFDLYVAYYGEPAEFQDYLADDTGNVDDPNDQKLYFIDRMRERSGEGERQSAEWDRMSALIEAIEDTEAG